MKNTNRAGDNDKERNTKKQVRRKIEAFKPAELTAGAISVSDDGLVLGLHSLSEDGYVAGVDLSNEQFDALQATAMAAGKSLSELLCKALQNMVEPAVVISQKPPLDVCWNCVRGNN